MQDLPVVHTDADVAALMVLIAIEATKVFERTIVSNLYLIAKGDTDAGCTAPLVFGGALIGTSFDKTVFAQFLLYLLFAFVLELHDNAIASEEILMLGETNQHGTSHRPLRTIGSTRIPGQGEEVTAGDLHSILTNDAFHSLVARGRLPLLEHSIEVQAMHLPLSLLFGDDGHQVAKHRVGLCRLIVGTVGAIFDRERTETDGIVFGKDITCLCTIGLRTTYLRDEERIVGQSILACPCCESRIIKIGSQTKQRGCCGIPDVLEVGQRACCRILPRFATSTVHGRIYIDGQRIDGLHGLSHAFHISCIIVRREILIAIDISSESLAPSGIFQLICTQGIQTSLQLRMKVPLILLEVGHQVLRNGSIILLDSLRAIVAGIFEHTNLVLDLHHEDSPLFAIDLLQMLEPSLEGTIVGFEDILGECRGYLQRFTSLGMSTRETLVIDLEPFGRITRHRVFPRTKPQIDHAKIIFASFLDDCIDQGEIVLTFNRLEKVPIVGYKHRIESHAMQVGKATGNVFRTGGRAVGCFATDDQKGFAINNQLFRSSMLAHRSLLSKETNAEG